MKKDQMALAAIYQGIPKEMLWAESEKEISKEAWECIKVIYQGAKRVKDSRVQTLREELDGLRMKSIELVDNFAMKVNSIVIMIRGLGDKMEDLHVIRKILRATPNKFLQIVASIKQFSDLETMTVEEVFGRLWAYEERLCGNNDDIDINVKHVLLTKAQWRAKEKDEDEHLLLTQEQWRAKEQKDGGEGSSNSGGRGSKNQKVDKAKVRCYKCNDFGHYQWERENSNK
ncbi:uncharacterized protein LOC133907209 [Phragmites australis]|uniref:uncharacterized protein LOC133907209 n=1 Tax=Phragmites australis TaxID=29695 RepID=UPI002D77834E|nr:uncharacterized protein LOC133907209 [Phragmites australis]